ncbi:hypothetical protein SLS60_012092 [Paraconiothyrium brasiliense]|uniref:Uncharacterized protein n=1 Tax=Paraconiothyrium brasiliense TaxID=300254 RepID=A0ABR3QGK1_9PLEO
MRIVAATMTAPPMLDVAIDLRRSGSGSLNDESRMSGFGPVNFARRNAIKTAAPAVTSLPLANGTRTVLASSLAP